MHNIPLKFCFRASTLKFFPFRKQHIRASLLCTVLVAEGKAMLHLIKWKVYSLRKQGVRVEVKVQSTASRCSEPPCLSPACFISNNCIIPFLGKLKDVFSVSSEVFLPPNFGYSIRRRMLTVWGASIGECGDRETLPVFLFHCSVSAMAEIMGG